MNSDPKEVSSAQLQTEIEAATHELKTFVSFFGKSKRLPQGPTTFYANLKTLEGQTACVELTIQGWRCISSNFDCTDEKQREADLPQRHYETIDQLLNNISPKYRERFAESLGKALTNLQEERRKENSQ